MPKVLMGPTTLAKGNGAHMQLLRNAGFEIVIPARDGILTEEELLREIPEVSASIAGTEPYTRRVLAAAKKLRVIARAGVGYDAVDVPAASEHGVVVTITPRANFDAVAEHAWAMLLALAKDIVQQDQGTRAGKWPRQANLPLRGHTLGLIGLGRIGKAVALRAPPFKMRVLAYEPFPDKAFVSENKIELAPLERVLAESDYISLHLPMSAETKHLINRRTLALMKPTAFLINTARGLLVCEADLLEALQNGRIAGAALDVFEVEPAITNPLFGLKNVIFAPHTAGVDRQSLADMALHAAESIVALSRGEWPAEQVVNAEVKAKFRW